MWLARSGLDGTGRPWGCLVAVLALMWAAIAKAEPSLIYLDLGCDVQSSQNYDGCRYPMATGGAHLVKHPNIRIRIFVCRAPVFGFGFGFFCLYLDSDSDLRRVSVSRIRSDYLVSAAHIRYSYLFIWFWRVFVSRSRPDYLVSAAHIRYSYLFIILSAKIQ